MSLILVRIYNNIGNASLISIVREKQPSKELFNLCMLRRILGTLTSLPAPLAFYKNGLTGKHLVSPYKAHTLSHK